MAKRVLVVVGLLAVAGLGMWRSLSESTDATATRSTASPTAVRAHPTLGVDGAADSAAGKSIERPSSRVVRMANPEAQRRELATQIAAAIARRAASPQTADRGPNMDSPDQVLTELQAALQQVRDYVSECVDRTDPTLRGFQAAMTLTGDPDVGTLIDATALSSLGGVPLPAALDDCVRAVMQSLELPPLAVGTAFKVTYELTFDD